MIELFLIRFLLEKNNSLKKNFIVRRNLFGNFAKSLRPVILKSIESSHKLVNFQKQSPGENVFLKFQKIFWEKPVAESFLKSVLHRCFPVNVAEFLRYSKTRTLFQNPFLQTFRLKAFHFAKKKV